MKLYELDCVRNDYHGTVKNYSTSTSWDHPYVSGGGTKHADSFLAFFYSF